MSLSNDWFALPSVGDYHCVFEILYEVPGLRNNSLSMILVLNNGSSSIKFALFDSPDQPPLAKGVVESLQSDPCRLKGQFNGMEVEESWRGKNYHDAMEALIGQLRSRHDNLHSLQAIGHRVVHGGESFPGPVWIDDAVLAEIERLSDLAPLHNPVNAGGIRFCRKLFPKLPQAAVFDTSFHHTLPPRAYRYALPDELYQQHRIRRYGFHGTSHQFVAQEAARRLGRDLESLALITVHLGNGCSASAVLNGKSVETSMGLTPQEGMVMGTRSGDLDPTLPGFLSEHLQRSMKDINEMISKRSGLLGLSGIGNDCRELETARKKGDPKAELALDVFCYRAARTIMSLTAALPRVDALVFTAGIGEHSSFVRKQIVSHLPLLNIRLDSIRNQKHGAHSNGWISDDSPTPCLVVPTDEEQAIARLTDRLLRP